MADSIRFSFGIYAMISCTLLVLLLLHTMTIHMEFYSIIAKLTTWKVALAIEYNFAIMVGLTFVKAFIYLLVGRLRDLEIEQIIDSGRSFLLDTILFLVLSSPTLHGAELSATQLIKFLTMLLLLKAIHLILQIRGTSIFDTGIPRYSSVIRLYILLFILLVADITAVNFFFIHSSRASTFYLWLLFESIGMLSSSVLSGLKLFVNLIDLRSESGWASKPAVVFYLDLIHDLLSLGIFLVFMFVFFLAQPSRLPLYMTADILNVSKALYRRLVSFRKFRALTKNLETRFPNATPEEIQAADTCIICRDLLAEGSKKLPCSHIFHIECLRGWLVQQQSCPTCRADIPIEPSRPVSTEIPSTETPTQPTNISPVQESPSPILTSPIHVENHTSSEAYNTIPSNIKETALETSMRMFQVYRAHANIWLMEAQLAQLQLAKQILSEGNQVLKNDSLKSESNASLVDHEKLLKLYTDLTSMYNPLVQNTASSSAFEGMNSLYSNTIFDTMALKQGMNSKDCSTQTEEVNKLDKEDSQNFIEYNQSSSMDSSFDYLPKLQREESLRLRMEQRRRWQEYKNE